MWSVPRSNLDNWRYRPVEGSIVDVKQQAMEAASEDLVEECHCGERLPSKD
jgi:hypothetical protein